MTLCVIISIRLSWDNHSVSSGICISHLILATLPSRPLVSLNVVPSALESGGGLGLPGQEIRWARGWTWGGWGGRGRWRWGRRGGWWGKDGGGRGDKSIVDNGIVHRLGLVRILGLIAGLLLIWGGIPGTRGGRGVARVGGGRGVAWVRGVPGLGLDSIRGLGGIIITSLQANRQEQKN